MPRIGTLCGSRFVGGWFRSRNQRRFRSREQRHPSRPSHVRRDERVRQSGPARREVRGATLEAVCGVTQQGVDGPTRRSSSVSRGVLDRATANSFAADHHGPLQDDRAVKTKLLKRSCLRGLDQGLGSTRARCSRNRPLEPLCTMAWLAQGWAGHPCSLRRLRLTSTRIPARRDSGRGRAVLGHALGEFGDARVALHRSLLSEGAARGSPAYRT